MLVVLVAAACGAPAPVELAPTVPPATAVTSTTPPPEFEPPRLDTFDPGVAVSVVVPAAGQPWEEVTAGLDVASPSGAVEVQLDSCTEVGPQQWRVEGSAVTPTEAATALFQFESVDWDVVESIPVEVEFSGTGDFSFVADFLTRSATDDHFYWPAPGYHPDENGCVINLSHGSDGVKRGSWTLPAERSSQPITWRAPDDSIQGVGLGVSMADRDDPKLSWMALAWLGGGPGLDTLWVPTDPLLSVREMSRSGACESVMLGDEQESIVVQLLRRCDMTIWVGDDLPDGSALPEVDGFEWAMWAEAPALLTRRDGWTIAVHSGIEPDADAIRQVAESLVPMRNFVAKDPTVPGVGPDSDRVIEEMLELEGLTERGRRQIHPALLAVLATDAGNMVHNFEVAWRDDVWVADHFGYSGGGDLCLSGGGTNHEATPDGLYAYLLAAEQEWTIQAQIDGEWQTLPSQDGVAWVDDLAPVPYRALDVSGDPVYCSWPILEEGETWSPWQPPNARWDLELTANPDRGLADGDVVSIHANGFPGGATIDISICRVSDPARPDIAECQPLDESEERYGRTDPDGSIDRTYTVVRRFTSDLGDEIDCASSRCVIQVTTNSGFARVGQAELSFD